MDHSPAKKELYFAIFSWPFNFTKHPTSYNYHAYPDPGLRERCPHGNVLPRADVGVPVSREQSLELLQLLRREVSPLPPLPLVVDVVVVLAAAAVLRLTVLGLVDLAVRVIGALTGDL